MKKHEKHFFKVQSWKKDELDGSSRGEFAISMQHMEGAWKMSMFSARWEYTLEFV